jgi:3-deoxy-D-manno-octulosonic-acid transferase
MSLLPLWPHKLVMKTLYSLAITLYSVLIGIYAIFNKKARQWVEGRRRWRSKISDFKNNTGHVIWVHCASLGEFEQGRPLIEKIRAEKQGWKIVVTFYSPSGYEIRKNYSNADLVMYLPADTFINAWDFIKAIKPDVAVFIKYEFWYNYLNILKRKDIPVYLVSAIFRPNQLFFKWYGGFYRLMLPKFSHIFVQNQESFDLLKSIGYNDCSITGDTRFDRVSQIAGNARDLPLIAGFCDNERLFIAGSSWEPDEDIIIRYINEHPGRMKWLFAPHLIDEAHISRIEKKLNTTCSRYSVYNSDDKTTRVLIIDNIGMLSSVYRYGSYAEIGGGFGKGIHNILEPACWGIPVLFGPNHNIFLEAKEMIEREGAYTFSSYDEFYSIMESLESDNGKYSQACTTARNYIAENTGATAKVFNIVFANNLNNRQ